MKSGEFMNSSEQSERTDVTILIERAMRGDDSVWGEVYEKTHRYVYFIALKILRNEQDAQDTAHDVYIQVIRSIGQLYSADSFYGWLRRIIFSKCTDLKKKKKPILADDYDISLEDTPEVSEQFLPDMLLDSVETRRMVMEIIDALPDAQRQTVLFYYYDEMNIDQIGALMECSPGTVKSRLNYARAKIKNGVEEHEKKGVKLYGISTLPIIAILLREQAQACEIPPALGASLSPILGGASQSNGMSALTGAESAVTKTTFVLSSKLIAGIVATVVISVGGIAWFLLQNQPIADAPSHTVVELSNNTESASPNESVELGNTAQVTFAIPETITVFMDNLYDALYNDDISLVYNLMSDKSVHSWFATLDHKTEVFYNAESGSATVNERDASADVYNYRDRFNYSKGVSEPHFGIEFAQSRDDPGQYVMMVQYGKRENGFSYHTANIHYYNGETIQFDWEDMIYQDGKATGAFKRYTFQPINGGGIYDNYWIAQSGNTVDGYYEGDVYEERHNVNDGTEVQVVTWLLKYVGGIVQPIGGTDDEGKIPYASFVGDTLGTPDQPPQTMPADSPEWNIHRPYEGIGL
jgi:RNA polymerase sigma-70 factor (ECF subfamily)